MGEVSDGSLRLFPLFAGVMLVLFGLFVVVCYPPTVVRGKFGGEVFAFLVGGLGLFSGVGFLLGFINEQVRMGEAKVFEDGEAVEDVTTPLDEGREGLVCALYAGRSCIGATRLRLARVAGVLLIGMTSWSGCMSKGRARLAEYT
ncbi:MAG: hypothetical protein WED04_00480 [Promethearchaeati archaeon SRVP18_Atabeyarchaeia-1]